MIEKQAIKSFYRPGKMVSGAISAPFPSAAFRFFKESLLQFQRRFPKHGKARNNFGTPFPDLGMAAAPVF
jgi:hypothetical protein